MYVSSGKRKVYPRVYGEPLHHELNLIPKRVYPRVYGGTFTPPEIKRIKTGLSPRVRGNPRHRANTDGQRWSIPACTGEPHSHRASSRPTRVYPRVYGGTSTAIDPQSKVSGLSPRVRGNHG